MAGFLFDGTVGGIARTRDPIISAGNGLRNDLAWYMMYWITVLPGD